MKTTRIPNTIQDHIAETLFIPLLMKRNETHRENPFFTDSFACEMVDRIDYDFSRFEGAVKSSVGVAIRSKYYDQVTREFIDSHDAPVVVNVGCGLDARFQRLGKAVTARAVFYEMDLPETMDLREKLLEPSENDIYLKASMFETGWMDTLKAKHPRSSFLFIVEGVFMYFEKEQMKQVFVHLAQRFAQSRILFDVTSSWMCKNSHRHDTVKNTNAPFKLALDDNREIESWADNLTLESVRHYGDFKDWKQSGLMVTWMMKLVPFLKNASRMLCYRIG